MAGKLRTIFARELTKELAAFDVNEEIIEPISAANSSEENIEGKTDLRGVIKSSLLVSLNISRDCSI